MDKSHNYAKCKKLGGVGHEILIWFHLHKNLDNANESIMITNNITSHLRNRKEKRKGRGGSTISKGHRETFQVMVSEM